MKHQVIVLIGDLEGSRELEEGHRSDLQRRLKQKMEELNAQSARLLSPLTVTLGDEFQAVYHRADELFLHAWKILEVTHPVNVRFSWATGTLSTPLNREQALGMDGPAFHRARAGIERMKKNHHLFEVRFDENDDAVNRLAGASLKLVSDAFRSWNKNRCVITSRLAEQHKVSDIAGELGISEVAVYKNIKAGSLDTMLDLVREIQNILNERLVS